MIAAELAPDRTESLSNGDFTADVVVSQLNRRLQVTGYQGPDLTALAGALAARAREFGFGKVWLKARRADRAALEAGGFDHEATICGYFSGQDAEVMALFVTEERRRRPALDDQVRILGRVTERPPDPSLPALPAGYHSASAVERDADDLAGLYRTVFASYPFPIADPDYLRATLASHVHYRILRDAAGRLVAAASAETAPTLGSAEMTDFATLPDQRGLGLAQHLLAGLEETMSGAGIGNLYTIARARSTGMNRVFYNRGYLLTGTLVNNCHIAGRFEDMHVWSRPPGAASARETLPG